MKKPNLIQGHSDGYLRIFIEGKIVYYHRFLIEQKLGRKLRKGEVVHHKNGNKLDNRFINLEIMSNPQHSHIHRRVADKVEITCPVCKKKKTLYKKFYEWKKDRGQRNFYCSRECVHIGLKEYACVV